MDPSSRSYEASGASLRALRPALAFLFRHGHDVGRFLAEFGIDSLAISRPDARVSGPTLVKAWRRAAELASDPAFGLHVATSLDLNGLTSLSSDYVPLQTLIKSATLGDGLRRFARFFPLTIPFVRVEVCRFSAGQVLTRFLQRNVPFGSREIGEFWISLLVLISRRFAASPVSIKEVRFSYPDPPSLPVYTDALGAPVRFAADDDAIVFAEEALDVPLCSASPEAGSLIRLGEELLARLPPSETLGDQVRSALAARLESGEVSMTAVAKEMGVSERTLARKLDDAGTSYQTLLDEVRAAFAREYLAQKRMSLEEIAAKLGFADIRSLQRAFRRWYGQSPTEFLQKKR